MKSWTDSLKVFHLKPRHLFAVALFGALVLFLPDRAAASLGISEIREKYRGWVGLATLAALVIWISWHYSGGNAEGVS